METPLVVIDFRNKSIYTVTDPPREPKIAQALRDSHAESATTPVAAK